MPTIAFFSGITIRMYFIRSEHHPPHVHASYGGRTAEISIREGNVLEGMLPPRILNKVRTRGRIHQSELLHIWETQEFHRIENPDF